MTTLHTLSGRWKLGFLLTLTTCFWWSILPITLFGVMHKLDPFTVTFYRFFFAVVILLPVLLMRPKALSDLRVISKPSVLKKLILAGLLLTLNYGFYVLALERMSPAGAQVLIQLAPMLFLLSGVFLFKESFSVLQWLGFFAFIAGMLLFFHLRLSGLIEGSKENQDYAIGMLLMVAAAVCWAGYAIATKKLSSSLTALQLMVLINTIGSLCFLPLAHPTLVLQLTSFEWLLLVLCGLNTVFAYGSFSEALNHWEASRISAMFTLVPLLTIGFVYLLEFFPVVKVVAEPMDWISISGALLVVTGAALASLAGAKG